MRSDLLRFQEDANFVMDSIPRFVEQLLSYVEERQHVWERENLRRKDYLDDCFRALNYCLNARDSEGRRPNCDEEEREALRARVALEESVANLQDIKHWRAMIETESESFKNRTASFRMAISDQVPKAAFAVNEIADRAATVHGSPAFLGHVSSHMSNAFQVVTPQSSPPSSIPAQPQGMHAPSSREGQVREGPGNVEGAEGTFRITLGGKAKR